LNPQKILASVNIIMLEVRYLSQRKIPRRIDGHDYFVGITNKGTVVIGPKDTGIEGLELHWTAYTHKNGVFLDHLSVKYKGKTIYRKNTWYDTR